MSISAPGRRDAFVGAGVGFAHSKLARPDRRRSRQRLRADTSKTNFAWALHAGVGYAVTQNLKLELSYRYLNTGTFKSNPIVCEATAGCFFERQSFKEAVARLPRRHALDVRGGNLRACAALRAYAAAAGPLVRKY